MEYVCAECKKQVEDEDAVWYQGKAYHVACCPEQEE